MNFEPFIIYIKDNEGKHLRTIMKKKTYNCLERKFKGNNCLCTIFSLHWIPC